MFIAAAQQSGRNFPRHVSWLTSSTEGGKASVAVDVGCSLQASATKWYFHDGNLPKTAMIGHDVRGAHTKPTVLDNGSGMSGESLRGRSLGALDIVLDRGNCRRAIVT
jgi:hypothetical protein